MPRFVQALAAFSAGSLLAAAPLPFQIDCVVRGAIGADTLAVRCGLVSKTLHLETIDGPEPDQPFGTTAAAVAGAALARRPAYVTVNGESDGEWQGVAQLDGGRDLAEQLVALGLAWPAVGPLGEGMARALLGAQKVRIGIWRRGDAIAPWEWRKQHPPGGVRDEASPLGEVEGRDAFARFEAEERQRRAGEDEVRYGDRVRYLEMQLCHLEGGDPTFCFDRIKRRWPVQAQPK